MVLLPFPIAYSGREEGMQDLKSQDCFQEQIPSEVTSEHQTCHLSQLNPSSPAPTSLISLLPSVFWFPSFLSGKRKPTRKSHWALGLLALPGFWAAHVSLLPATNPPHCPAHPSPDHTASCCVMCDASCGGTGSNTRRNWSLAWSMHFRVEGWAGTSAWTRTRKLLKTTVECK